MYSRQLSTRMKVAAMTAALAEYPSSEQVSRWAAEVLELEKLVDRLRDWRTDVRTDGSVG